MILLLLANVSFAMGYSLPVIRHHHTTARAVHPSQMLHDEERVQMYHKEDSGECTMIRAEEPLEDPSFACWLNPDSDSLNDYICVQEHPCLDIDDQIEHSDDSY